MSMEEEDEENETEPSEINEVIESKSSLLNSPIDLNIGRMTTKSLEPLIWCNYETAPNKLKITNTGKAVFLTAEWENETPFLSGGPFLSQQIFSQMHFHWGPNDMEGSDHSIDGESLPMELHAVHFKKDYTNHEAALRQSDGISILVYFFKLQSMANLKMYEIVQSLHLIKQAETSTRIVPWPISNLLRCFVDDYFLYRGSISSAHYNNSVTWLISRESIGISAQQVAEFRTLKNSKLGPAGRKKHGILNATDNGIVYHVNPSGSMYSSLLPISRSLLPPRNNNCIEHFSISETSDIEE